MTIRIERWSGDPEPAALALDAGFSDYFMPGRHTPESVLALLRAGLVDPSASYLAWDGSRPVGAAMAKVRDDGRARVAAMAVAPQARGRKVGRGLLRAVVDGAIGAHAVHLEVLRQNERAIRLYDSEGFVRTRGLVALRTALHASDGPDPALRVGGLALLPRHGDLRPPRPLHRDRVAIERMPDVKVAIEAGSGEWIAWRNDVVLHVGGGAEASSVKRLLSALPSGAYKLIDVPDDDPLADVLLGSRWVVFAEQWEMVRRR